MNVFDVATLRSGKVPGIKQPARKQQVGTLSFLTLPQSGVHYGTEYASQIRTL